MDKLETYIEQKTRHGEELNAFQGLFWAFNNEQFQEGLDKLGIKKEDAGEKLYSIDAGGYMLKSQSDAFKAMFKRHEQERKELRKNTKLLFGALVYELRNHEYCITYNPQDALDALGLTKDDVDASFLKKACREAI